MISQYLSPEPLLQSPTWVASELREGYQIPAYSYARNNPIANTDPTGLYVGSGLAMCWSDCVRETLLDEPLTASQSVLYPGAAAAGSEVCQQAVGEAAYKFGTDALEVAGSSFRIVRGAGGAAAAGALAAQAACFIHCRLSFEPNERYRGPGDRNDFGPSMFSGPFRGPRY